MKKRILTLLLIFCCVFGVGNFVSASTIPFDITVTAYGPSNPDPYSYRAVSYTHLDVYKRQGEIQNVSILVAIGVSNDGCREIIGAAEGMKEDKESWRSFFVWLKERGLKGVRLIIGDKNLGMLETIPEVFPDARYQRCTCLLYTSRCV